MKKILLTFLILIVINIILIFKLPLIADKIGTILHIKSFNNFVVYLGDNYNNFFENGGDKKLIDNLNYTISGAIKIKNEIINKAEDTKTIVDNLRLNLSGSEDFINDINDNISNINNKYNDTKIIIGESINTVNNIKENIDIIKTGITNSGTLYQSGNLDEINTNTGEIN